MKITLSTRHCLRPLLVVLCLVSVSAMGAETVGDTDFDVQSPSVMAIRKSLAERHAILKEHFQAGVIGLTHDGLIAMREAAGLAPDMRATLERLVAEDNKDRGTLYREIARANGRPDWESQFQNVFAERWIRRAPSGWYYRDSGGRWIKKLPSAANDGVPENTASVAPYPGN
ncbi:MAG: YdbL family protein [Betaproteobacteria bacterium]|nr:YdbL family protein [Betaproteobacteria bacterium]